MKHQILARAAIGAAAVLLPLAACSTEDGASPRSPSTSPSASSNPTTEARDSKHATGTYTARGVYGGAPSYMDFTITLQDGVITDVGSKLMPENNETSHGYQERFAAAVPGEVEGKPVDGLRVGKIAGASGCADGFNDALAKIRMQASGQEASPKRLPIRAHGHDRKLMSARGVLAVPSPPRADHLASIS
ncbi:hypothetical protein [Streptomyces sp. NPDC058045]|uniref:hypothetical protein n=1 Tax=Streptomyces sp. NPDC058045 TaxID=3346311 RepID=UPI0036EC1943